MSTSRRSLDSESNFSLVDHGYANESVSVLSGGASQYGNETRYGQSGVGGHPPNNASSYSISTVLSNPNASSAAATISTNLNNLNPLRSTTGPKTGATRGKAATPIVLSELPKVSRKEFDSYIASIKEDWATWNRLQADIKEPALLDELDVEDVLDEAAAKRRKAIAQALEGSSFATRGSKRTELPSLDGIPRVFFEENFNLNNPRTFDIVTGSHGDSQAGREGASQPRQSLADLATDQILQEKLSHYLDIVEVHLSVEISLRSASFFSALSNLQALNSQSAQALQQIGALKEMLTEVDQTVAQKGLDVVQLGTRRQRLNKLDAAIERVKDIVRTVDQAEELGEAGEIEGALDLVEALENEWEASIDDRPSTATMPGTGAEYQLPAISEDELDKSTAKPPKTPQTAIFHKNASRHAPVRIAKIAALQSIPTRLGDLRSNIAQSLETELTAVLTHEIRESLSQYTADPGHWNTPTGEDNLTHLQTAKESLNMRVTSTIAGLVRCGKPALDSAVAAYRQVLLKEIRRTLRDALPQSANSNLGEEDDGLGDHTPSSRESLDGGRPSLDGRAPAINNLRNMAHNDYVKLIRTLNTSMLGCIKIADLHSQVIVEIVSAVLDEHYSSDNKVSAEDQTTSWRALNEAWLEALRNDMGDIVQSATELANIRLAKVVASRADAHASLSLPEFVIVFSESWQFVLDCEVICRKMIVGLRGVIVGQAKSFLQHFHHVHISESVKQIETEQWTPVDITASAQDVVQHILDSAVNNPSELILTKVTDDSVLPNKPAQATSKMLKIEDREFYAVSAAMHCLEALEEYLKIVLNLPLLTTDVMSKIVEFVKQFNSRTCQVVLGAGAMRSAGLKNITAKHLALASQSLSIMITLIPYIRECLRRHLRAKQAVILVDFDKVKRDYQEHQNEIHAKLVGIMGDRLAVHCKSLQGIDWEKKATGDVTSPNTYMEALTKDTVTLHRVLYRYLPGSALELVMMQVLSAINSRLAEEYGKIEIHSDAARERILSDAKYMKNKFAELKGLERPPPGAELEDLIRMKRVEVQVEVAPAPPSKQFVTPSLTAARKSLSVESRRASVSASSKNEQAKVIMPPVLPASEVTKPEGSANDSTTAEHVKPKDTTYGTLPSENESRSASAPPPTSSEAEGDKEPAVNKEVNDKQTKDEESAKEDTANSIPPEAVPLPLSPAAEDDSHQETISSLLSAHKPLKEESESLQADTATSVIPLASKQEPEAPATPIKDHLKKSEVSVTSAENKRSQTVSPPNAGSPAPGGNVKNRLASLFNKRAASSPASQVSQPTKSQSLLTSSEVPSSEVPLETVHSQVPSVPASLPDVTLSTLAAMSDLPDDKHTLVTSPTKLQDSSNTGGERVSIDSPATEIAALAEASQTSPRVATETVVNVEDAPDDLQGSHTQIDQPASDFLVPPALPETSGHVVSASSDVSSEDLLEAVPSSSDAGHVESSAVTDASNVEDVQPDSQLAVSALSANDDLEGQGQEEEAEKPEITEEVRPELQEPEAGNEEEAVKTELSPKIDEATDLDDQGKETGNEDTQETLATPTSLLSTAAAEAVDYNTQSTTAGEKATASFADDQIGVEPASAIEKGECPEVSPSTSTMLDPTNQSLSTTEGSQSDGEDEGETSVESFVSDSAIGDGNTVKNDDLDDVD